MIQPADRAGLRQEVYFAAFCLAEQQGDADAYALFALAVQAQRAMADTLPPPAGALSRQCAAESRAWRPYCAIHTSIT